MNAKLDVKSQRACGENDKARHVMTRLQHLDPELRLSEN